MICAEDGDGGWHGSIVKDEGSKGKQKKKR
jgi:hypothetical protein